MNLRRFALITASALLVVGALAASLLALTARQSSVASTAALPAAELQNPGTWKEQFSDCTNGIMTAAVLLNDDVQGCLVDVMKTAIDVGALSALETAIADLTSESSGFMAACHSPGHKAGRYFFEQNPDIAERLAANNSGACLYAIGHGILDGFADSSPSPDEFRQAAAACSQLVKDKPAVHGLCADGLGHAAWSSSKDITQATLLCAQFAEPMHQTACGEGIVMQVYEPAGFLPSSDPAAAPSTLPSMCAQWDGVSLDVLKGCFMGAGYIYTRPAWVTATDWSSRNGDVPLDSDAVRRLASDIAGAVDNCKAHLSDLGRDTCEYSVSQQVPWIAYSDPAVTKAVCASLTTYRQRCITWQHPGL